jgi:oxygen-independent coproporphyrinogen-3 oxidase
MMSRDALLRKYDVPVPRYTSYPTVPYWDTDRFNASVWTDLVRQEFERSNDTQGISLYIHLPFCESLCTYCACNTRITRNHAVEARYSEAVLAEWDSYLRIFGRTPVIRELHIGGGTPTFFSPDNLGHLVEGILSRCQVHEDRAFSFEGHPNNTTAEHLRVLHALGFDRVSFGVQDLDMKVQLAIHRIQSYESLAEVTRLSREAGYRSVSYDLIYGLPHQTVASVEHTLEKVCALKPDRLAFYSYAHVPWIRPGQRGYEDAHLPSDVLKRELYERGDAVLRRQGYSSIGMDHYALPGDDLHIAHDTGRLHRNFMGYTTTSTRLLIGLGASAISDAYSAYAQNVKGVEEYEALAKRGELPLLKGHIQSEHDRLTRRCILDIACRGALDGGHLGAVCDEEMLDRLRAMEGEGIVALGSDGLRVTELGQAFVRNVCSVFDARMRNRSERKDVGFSKGI